MEFYFSFIYYGCFGLAMMYRMISDFTWHVSTGPGKENLIFSLFSATPGRDTISLIHPSWLPNMLITIINKTAVLSNQVGDILNGMLTLYQRVGSILAIYVHNPMNMTNPR